MKHSFLIMMLMSVTALARADEIEPAVNTSAVEPPPAETTPPPSAPAPAAAPTAKPPAKAAAPARSAPGQKSNAHDLIELDPTQITGNKELPNVMYVVPWKRPDLGDLGGRPAKSLINEVLAPVDRDVFRRQNRYFAALQAQAAATPAKPAAPPAPGATATLPSKDEK
jgi:hypothetical protein